MALSSPLIDLTDYQREKVMDRSRFRIDMWARQTGKSFASTLADTLSAAEGAPWVILSSGERGSKENIEKCRMHAQAIGAAAEAIERDYRTDDGTFTAHEVRFPSGGRIVGLPANPATARGHSANVDLDEFSTHRDSRQIWTALFPTVNRGYRLRVNGTPLGKQNKFYELWRDWNDYIASERSGYAARKITIYDAIAGGLDLRDPDGRPCTPEDLREALGDEDAWAQEYLCEFLDEATAYITYDMIASCEHEEATLDWSEDRVISGPLYVGMDVARKRDLTVIWVCERLGDVSWTRAVKVMEKASFRAQREALYYFLSLPGLARACIDATGIGAQLAEEAQQLFGSYRVEAVTFTAQVKEDLAVRLRTRMEDRLIRLPADRAVREDLHAVKKIVTAAGNVRYDAERTEAGHADRFWALALAEMAGAAVQPAAEVAIARRTTIARLVREGIFVAPRRESMRDVFAQIGF
jgi:phage FluMu gp28-like protein